MVRIKKIIRMLFVIMCLMFICTLNVMAYGSNTGSITVKIPPLEDESVENIEISINKIADIVEGEYVLRSDYKDVNVDLNSIDSGESYKKAADTFLKATLGKENQIHLYTDKNGEAAAKNLEEGVYIVSSKADEKIGELSTAIIDIPHWNEVSNVMEYNIVCEPKRNGDTPKINTPPKTGDDIEIYVPAIMFVLSTLIIISAVSCKKHKVLDNK